jgi:5-methylcytosine-specific restriction endonuclease McrA
MSEYFNPQIKRVPIRLRGAEYTRFKQDIFRRDGWRCRNPECGDPYAWEPVNEITLHHKIKRSQGGSDTGDNCFSICLKCHDLIEEHKLSEDFLMEENQSD